MNYKGHVALNAVAFAGMAYVAHRFRVPVYNRLYFTIGYAFSTFFLSPDLDLFYSKASKNWKLLRVIWWPYSKLMKHRGLSHSLLLSTLSKLLYISVVVILAYTLFLLGVVYFAQEELILNSAYLLQSLSIFSKSVAELFTKHWPIIRYILLGVWLSDIVHIFIGDRITSALKIILKP